MDKSVDATVSDAMDHFLPFIIKLGADEVQNKMDSEVFDFFGDKHVSAADRFGEWLNDLAGTPDAAESFAALGFTEYLLAKRLRDSLAKMTDTVLWMSGSNDFGPEGQAHEGWLAVQPAIAEARALLSSIEESRGS